ncbi:MAG: HAD hydrolase-like protein, partial [Bacillales bacterium]|nr:HAD hydrolase-like protein [Bacillales bacterium]
HHPDKGFEGERIEYKIDCNCRKPKPGMLIKASEDFNIDLASSWMIGDSKNDILCGKNAMCKTGYVGDDIDIDCDLKGSSLLEIVNKII